MLHFHDAFEQIRGFLHECLPWHKVTHNIIWIYLLPCILVSCHNRHLVIRLTLQQQTIEPGMHQIPRGKLCKTLANILLIQQCHATTPSRQCSGVPHEPSSLRESRCNSQPRFSIKQNPFNNCSYTDLRQWQQPRQTRQLVGTLVR